ncbi:YadA C-terminal domain-containing protein [Vibrio sp. J383]|uniref:YadA C-terminal domain-containing protein n=1 Tax=Vibrio sp. J383 TaxID=2942997 RepID=UPI0020BF3879|nr:YadA C-terminal domain-containing protein [Vibrio sp. J383]UQV24245.1 YadA C-terminal domain-containing protein [Vibrio sp. J383]
MKKTIIALAVTSIFSTSAMAAQEINASDMIKASRNYSVMVDASGQSHLVDNKTQEIVAEIDYQDDNVFIRNDRNPEDTEYLHYDSEDGSITVSGQNKKDGEWSETRTIKDDLSGDDAKKPVDNSTITIAKIAKENGAVIVDGGNTVNFTKGDLKGLNYNVENGTIKDADGVAIGGVEKDGYITDTKGNRIARVNDNGTISMADNKTPNDDDSKLDPANGEIKPIVEPTGDVEKAVDDISNEVDKRIDAAGAAAYNEASAYATATDAKLANHESRIGSLEKDMQAMGNKMLVLEDRMDGVVASSHAITNARPVLNSAGQFGMGVGMGAAGSKQAIAIGGAYQISDNWSGTMSVNYETKGKVSNDQLSAGVGAQYIF